MSEKGETMWSIIIRNCWLTEKGHYDIYVIKDGKTVRSLENVTQPIRIVQEEINNLENEIRGTGRT